MQPASARIEPVDRNTVARSDGFQRPKPTGAMASQQKVSRLPQGGSAEQTRRTEGEGTRRSTLQNDLVVTQAGDTQAGNRVSVGPAPRRMGFSGLHALFPRSA